LVDEEEVAGGGRPADGLVLLLGDVKVELWKERSSWRSVWPRSP
jgi:hypothetical protein